MLKRRLLEYYNVKRLLNEKSMAIYAALLKHGYQNFSFTILEFCDIDSQALALEKNTSLKYILQSIIY